MKPCDNCDYTDCDNCKINEFEAIILDLKKGDCWCQCGIDNPMMQGKHSELCMKIQESMKDIHESKDT